MIRVLVTGAAGLLGQHLVSGLQSKCDIIAVDKLPDPFENHHNLHYLQADLTDSHALKRISESINVDWLFNCAAYTDVDGCEKDRRLAETLNVELVRSLLGLRCRRFIHYSTDYVFDGKSGPYSEDDPVKPLGYYGQTKLLSEDVLRESGKPHLIIRSNVLFGTGINTRPNFITWLIDSLRDKQRVRIVTDQYNNPISALNLAEASIEAADLGIDGILHLGGDDYISRYKIALIVARYFKLDETLIEPITSAQLGQTASRPLRGGLKIDKARSLLKTILMGFEEALSCLDKY